MEGPVSFVTSFYGRARGGIGRYEESLYAHLRQLVGARQAPIAPLPLAPGLVRLARVAGIDLQAVAENYPCWLPPEARDGIVHFSNQTQALALLAHRYPRAVITVHDIIPYVRVRDRWPDQHHRPSGWDALVSRLNLWALSRARRIIADSEHTKQDLGRRLKLPLDKIDVVPLGLDNSLFTPAPISGNFYERYGLCREDRLLLYVGSQEPRKNLKTIYQAMVSLRHRFPRLRLLVVGAPRTAEATPLPEAFTGVEDAVRFLGFVPEPDLRALYRLSDAFVFPSIYEGFGLPPLEAMACGCPVVAARASCLPEVVGDAGLLVAPLNVEAWVAAITQVLEDDDLRDHMRETGLKHARAFTWERTAAMTIDVYEMLA